jgi:hypothetical protein
MCAGTTLGFSASRDGKPFSIQGPMIVSTHREFEEVRRLR